MTSHSLCYIFFFFHNILSPNKSFEFLVIILFQKFISDFWQTHLVTFQRLTHKWMDVFVPAWKLCKIQKISRSLCMSYLFCFFVLRLVLNSDQNRGSCQRSRNCLVLRCHKGDLKTFLTPYRHLCKSNTLTLWKKCS